MRSGKVTKMAELVFSALFTAFFVVRIFKGPWMRNPQYVAAAVIGAVVVSGVLLRVSPDLEGDMIVGGLAGFAGAWGGIFAFDRLLAS